jgi:acyl-CoA reductase-like NAD-dependent aldehyde dehydrogenase
MKIDADFAMTINGQMVTTENTLPVYNPATRSVFAQVPDASKAQLDETVSTARQAFNLWSKTSADERQAALEAYADLIEANAEDIMSLLTREQGKPRAGAEFEVFGAIAWLRGIATQRLPEEGIEDTDERRVVTRMTPVGVVGAIVPWNFPILLAIWKIAPALMAGCTIIVKPSPYTPLCDLKIVELAQQVFPAGVLSALSGGDELGKWMTVHPDINKIAFTGSTETGRHVMRSAADTIKRVTLELGGNDPAIVMPDADPKALAPNIYFGVPSRIMPNSAMLSKRLYIHEDIYEEVRDALADFIANNIKVGDGTEADTDLGPIQNSMQYDKVKGYFADCHANGYEFAIGGEIDESAPGWFVPVSLVDNPPDNSRIVVEEPFGPILPLLKWSDEADVIARANDTIYGLGASVWGKDLEAVERVGSQLEAGTVWLNEIHQYSPFQAFGGHKQSGLGCENSLHGLMEYTNWQTTTLNKTSV